MNILASIKTDVTALRSVYIPQSPNFGLLGAMGKDGIVQIVGLAHGDAEGSVRLQRRGKRVIEGFTVVSGSTEVFVSRRVIVCGDTKGNASLIDVDHAEVENPPIYQVGTSLVIDVQPASPDRDVAAFALRDGAVSIFDFRTRSVDKRIKMTPQSKNLWALKYSSGLLYTGHESGHVFVWDMRSTGRYLAKHLDGNKEGVVSIDVRGEKVLATQTRSVASLLKFSRKPPKLAVEAREVLSTEDPTTIWSGQMLGDGGVVLGLGDGTLHKRPTLGQAGSGRETLKISNATITQVQEVPESPRLLSVSSMGSFSVVQF